MTQTNDIAADVARVLEFDEKSNPNCPSYPYDCEKHFMWAARIIRQLLAESDEREQQLRKALYPDGVKHPQQGEWSWMIERVSEQRASMVEARELIGLAKNTGSEIYLNKAIAALNTALGDKK